MEIIDYGGKKYFFSEEEQEQISFDFGKSFFLNNSKNLARRELTKYFSLKWIEGDKSIFLHSVILNVGDIKFDLIESLNSKKELEENLQNGSFLIVDVDKEDAKKLYVNALGGRFFEYVEDIKDINARRKDFRKGFAEFMQTRIVPRTNEAWEFLRQFSMKDYFIGFLENIRRILSYINEFENQVDISSFDGIEILFYRLKIKINDINYDFNNEIKEIENEIEREKNIGRRTSLRSLLRHVECIKSFQTLRRKFVFLDNKLNLLHSLKIDRDVFSQLDFEVKHKFLYSCLAYGSDILDTMIRVLNCDAISVEKKNKFINDIYENIDIKVDEIDKIPFYNVFHTKINEAVKSDQEILCPVVKSFIFEYLGVSDIHLPEDLNLMEIFFDIFTTNENKEYLKGNFNNISGNTYGFGIWTKLTDLQLYAEFLLDERQKIDELKSDLYSVLDLKSDSFPLLTYVGLVEAHKFFCDPEVPIESFKNLSTDLKYVLLKNFDAKTFSSLTSDFLSFLSANIEYQNFLMLNPDKIFLCMKMWQETPDFFEIKPLFKAFMFFEATENFSWRSNIRKKICRIKRRKYVGDSNLTSFLEKCSTIEQVKNICEIYHYGQNKIDGNFGIKEIEHFEIIDKQLKSFAPNDCAYFSWHENLCKLYSNAGKIGLFSKIFFDNNKVAIRLDEFFLTEISKYPLLVENLITSKSKFSDVKGKVISNDFLLFKWIEYQALDLEPYKLFLVQSLFYCLRETIEEANEEENYDISNNIHELKKFVLSLTSDFDISAKNINTLQDKIISSVKIPGALSKLNQQGELINNVEKVIDILDSETISPIKTDDNIDLKVRLMNFFLEEKIFNSKYYMEILSSIENTVLNLNSEDIVWALNNCLIAADATMAKKFKRENDLFNVELLKFIISKAINDSNESYVKIENIQYNYNNDSENIREIKSCLKNCDAIGNQIDKVKLYLTSGLNELNLDYINQKSLEDIKSELKNILQELQELNLDSEKHKKRKNLIYFIEEAVYPAIFMYKKIVPRAEIIIAEETRKRKEKLEMTSLSQILIKYIDPKYREYVINKIAELNEINLACVKNLIAENPENIKLIYRIFMIQDNTKNAMRIKTDKTNLNLNFRNTLYNANGFCVKTDINNMCSLFDVEKFSFLQENPDVLELISSLNCIWIDNLSLIVLVKIKKLMSKYQDSVLKVVLPAIFNAVDYEEQEQNKKMLQLLEKINFVTRDRKFFELLERNSYLGILINYIPAREELIYKIISDGNALNLLDKICFCNNFVFIINDKIDRFFEVYSIDSSLIKEDMTVDELCNINVEKMKLIKEYKTVLNTSTTSKWWQKSKTFEEREQVVEENFVRCADLISKCSNKLKRNISLEALNEAVEEIRYEFSNEHEKMNNIPPLVEEEISFRSRQ